MILRRAWIPPFVVGAAAAAAANMAIGLLLFSGEGLLRSLSLILAVELLALAAGLWSVPRSEGRALVESIRRRWFLCLLTFIGAAAFTTVWTLLGGFGAVGRAQAIGLALVGALPVYGSGVLLAGMVRFNTSVGGAAGGVGSAATLGAAAGMATTGIWALTELYPPSIFLFILVLLSASALVHGGVLDRALQAARLQDDAPPEIVDIESLAPTDSPDGVGAVSEDGPDA